MGRLRGARKAKKRVGEMVGWMAGSSVVPRELWKVGPMVRLTEYWMVG